MIRFEESTLEAGFAAPDGSRVEHTVFRRVDPLTGYSVRLTSRRPLDPAAKEGRLPDISEQVERTAGCPFCEGNLEVMTPVFSAYGTGLKRFSLGQSVLFPNLAPYGRHSAVCIFSNEHHVELGKFGKRLFGDALANCIAYCAAVEASAPACVHQVVSQNILPSSGGALLHPHFQVNVDVEPMNYHRLLLERQVSAQGTFVRELCEAEQSEGRRHIAGRGEWSLWASFAPLGEWEVQGCAPDIDRVSRLRGAVLDDLVSLVLSVHRFWRSRGRNAGNMALFGTTSAMHGLFFRMLPRSSYRPWYRSDRSCHEVGMLEAASDLLPEVLAEQMRPFF